MTVLTGQAVWREISEDIEFQQQPEAVREAMRPYIEELPTVLADLLGQPANLNNVTKAKLAFMRYCIDNGFIKAVVNAMPDDSAIFVFFDREDWAGQFEGMLNQLINMAEELTGDVEAWLKANGVTEEQIMLSPEVGLTGKARDLYRKGQLTVGELLRLKPMVIVKNTR